MKISVIQPLTEDTFYVTFLMFRVYVKSLHMSAGQVLAQKSMGLALVSRVIFWKSRTILCLHGPVKNRTEQSETELQQNLKRLPQLCALIKGQNKRPMAGTFKGTVDITRILWG